MPDVTGIDTLEQILGKDTKACVVMVSSLGTEATVQDCLKKGAKSFVQKPIQKDGMLATLRSVCGVPL
jgi:two-component system chemotaxis response regulator CheY